MPDIILALLNGLLILVGIPAMLYVLRRQGFWAGWGRLADRYTVGAWPKGGRTMPNQTAKIGAATYKNTLKAAITPEGLYLQRPAVSKAGRSPVCIPWDAFTAVESHRHLWTRFGVSGGASMRLQDPLGAAVEEALERASGANESGGLP